MAKDILTEESLSKDDIIVFIVAHLTAFMSLPVFTFAVALLWQTAWYDLITDKMRLSEWLLPKWAMAVCWLIYHEAVALGLFFLLIEFEHPEAHHPADRGFVVGWLLAGIVMGFFYPLAVTSMSNLVPAAFCATGALIGIGVTMGIEFFFTRQVHPRHLHLYNVAEWMLVFPTLWLLYNFCLAVDMAVVSTTDLDYINRSAAERKKPSRRPRKTDPGNVVTNIQDTLLGTESTGTTEASLEAMPVITETAAKHSRNPGSHTRNATIVKQKFDGDGYSHHK